MHQRFQHLPTSPEELFIVGGAARDHFLGITPKDVDFLVIGDVKTAHRIFKQKPIPVNQNEPVYTVRLENETFEVRVADDWYHDLLARDFTVNAIAIDVSDGEVFDPFGGVTDLRRGILRIVDTSTFGNSPERVGRAAMMVARFGLNPTQDTIRHCHRWSNAFGAIPKEQMWRQVWEKMLSKGKHFRKAFAFMDDCTALYHFPEITDMGDTSQHPTHHPEGDVLTHTLLAMEHAALMGYSPLVVSAMLMHDMGKPLVTEGEGENITAHGHETEHDPIRRFMRRIGFPQAMEQQVLTLVSHHMRKNNIPTNKSRAKLFRKLVAGGVTVENFVSVIDCDVNGRGKGLTDVPSDVAKFFAWAKTFDPDVVNTKQMRPLVNGNDLKALGIPQGKFLGKVLDEIADMYLAGVLTSKESALEYAKQAQIWRYDEKTRVFEIGRAGAGKGNHIPHEHLASVT